jgi:N utilization substance protein A
MSEDKSKKIIKDQSSLGQFSSAIAQICEEKGIDKERVISSIEAALAAAYKKDYGKRGQIIIAEMDENTSETKFKQLKEVVDETVRTIDEEYIPEEVHQVPENAVKSEEKMDRHVGERAEKKEEDDTEVNLPKFNSERDVLLADAKKVVKNIKVGDYIEYPLEVQDQYGRIASQTAKQVIIQKIREAEREAMYEEFKGKEGEIVNGTVQRVEAGKVFIDLGKSTGVLFPSEQIPGENYRIGQRLKLYIDKVDSDPRSLGIGLSRKHPQLLVKLFELEVPEIFAGTVEIKAVAREAGMRSKIAVVSHEEGIDPVGSCVGQKGTRVQAIIDELNGEKIDIIEWEDNPEEMIAQALSPAKVAKVELIEGEDESNQDNVGDEKGGEGEMEEVEEVDESTYKKAIAYVKNDQLSLAIGKRGQNVRLAAKLTGWNINVEALDSEETEEGDLEVDTEGENKKEEKVNDQEGGVKKSTQSEKGSEDGEGVEESGEENGGKKKEEKKEKGEGDDKKEGEETDKAKKEGKGKKEESEKEGEG